MIQTSQTTLKVTKALFAAQKAFKPVLKGAENPFFKSKYADLNSILEAVSDLLEAEGVMILQPVHTDGTQNLVTTRLLHVESGEFVDSTMKLELTKLTMQELGSAVSYARRYTLQSLLTLQAEDDDGNKSSKPAKKEGTVTRGSFKREEKVAEVPAKSAKVSGETDDGWD